MKKILLCLFFIAASLCVTGCIVDLQCLREGEIIRADNGCVSYCYHTEWIESCPVLPGDVCDVDTQKNEVICTCDPSKGSCVPTGQTTP